MDFPDHIATHIKVVFKVILAFIGLVVLMVIVYFVVRGASLVVNYMNEHWFGRW